jgi:hypothetical protein
LWKSVDAGMSWMELPGTNFDIGAAVADSRNPGTVYFLDINQSHSLHKSADGGQTWTATRLPPDYGPSSVLD